MMKRDIGVTHMVMGGRLHQQSIKESGEYKVQEDRKLLVTEQYFRPSSLPILNIRDLSAYFYGDDPRAIVLPDELLSTPEDTIINYFSALREAARPVKGIKTGCGTIGYAQTPYPVAYQFLSSQMQKEIPFQKYLKSFDNILHMNLIKLKQIPEDPKIPNTLKYFVEFETIEGSKKPQGLFAYYYGFVTLQKENNQFRITDVEWIEENFLCAPYHGWDWDAEAVVDVKYGTWCSMVEVRYPTEQVNFVKKVPFKGTDQTDYMIVFFELTNGTDIEIAQLKKDAHGNWGLIFINPEECLEKK